MEIKGKQTLYIKEQIFGTRESGGPGEPPPPMPRLHLAWANPIDKYILTQIGYILWSQNYFILQQLTHHSHFRRCTNLISFRNFKQNSFVDLKSNSALKSNEGNIFSFKTCPIQHDPMLRWIFLTNCNLKLSSWFDFIE